MQSESLVQRTKLTGRTPILVATVKENSSSVFKTSSTIVVSESQLDIYNSKNNDLKKSYYWSALDDIAIEKGELKLKFHKSKMNIELNSVTELFNTIGHILRHILPPIQLKNLDLKKNGFPHVIKSNFAAVIRLKSILADKGIMLSQDTNIAFDNLLRFSPSSFDVNSLPELYRISHIFFEILPLLTFISHISLPLNQCFTNLFNSPESLAKIKSIDFQGERQKDFSELLRKLANLPKRQFHAISFTQTEIIPEEIPAIRDFIIGTKLKSIGFHSAFSHEAMPLFESQILSTTLLNNLTILNLDGSHGINLQTLLPKCKNIVLLSLERCNLLLFDAIQLFSSMDFPKLKFLNLSGNICHSVPKHECKLPQSLYSLMINNISWSGDSLWAMISIITSRGPEPFKLSISKAYATQDVWNKVFNVLATTQYQSLTALTWDDNPISPKLFAFLKRNPYLDYLSMSYCFHSSIKNSAVDLCTFIATTQRLKFLIIRGNNKNYIGENSGSIIRAVSQNPSIVHFDITDNIIGDNGISQIRNLIMNNTTVQILAFDGSEPDNGIAYLEMMEIAAQRKQRMMVSFPSDDLAYLQSNNKITEEQYFGILNKFVRDPVIKKPKNGKEIPIPKNSPFLQPYNVFKYTPADQFPKYLTDAALEALMNPPKIQVNPQRQRPNSARAASVKNGPKTIVTNNMFGPKSDIRSATGQNRRAPFGAAARRAASVKGTPDRAPPISKIDVAKDDSEIPKPAVAPLFMQTNVIDDVDFNSFENESETTYSTLEPNVGVTFGAPPSKPRRAGISQSKPQATQRPQSRTSRRAPAPVITPRDDGIINSGSESDSESDQMTKAKPAIAFGKKPTARKQQIPTKKVASPLLIDDDTIPDTIPDEALIQNIIDSEPEEQPKRKRRRSKTSAASAKPPSSPSLFRPKANKREEEPPLEYPDSPPTMIDDSFVMHPKTAFSAKNSPPPSPELNRVINKQNGGGLTDRNRNSRTSRRNVPTSARQGPPQGRFEQIRPEQRAPNSAKPKDFQMDPTSIINSDDGLEPEPINKEPDPKPQRKGSKAPLIVVGSQRGSRPKHSEKKQEIPQKAPSRVQAPVIESDYEPEDEIPQKKPTVITKNVKQIESDYEPEEEVVQPQNPIKRPMRNKQQQQQKEVPKKPVPIVESDYEPEDEEPPKPKIEQKPQRITRKKPEVTNKPVPQIESDYEPEDEEPPKQQMPQRVTRNKPITTKQPIPQVESDYEPEDEEPPKQQPNSQRAISNKPIPQVESDYEPEDEEPPQKAQPVQRNRNQPEPNPKVTKANIPQVESDYEPEDEEPPKVNRRRRSARSSSAKREQVAPEQIKRPTSRASHAPKPKDLIPEPAPEPQPSRGRGSHSSLSHRAPAPNQDKEQLQSRPSRRGAASSLSSRNQPEPTSENKVPNRNTQSSLSSRRKEPHRNEPVVSLRKRSRAESVKNEIINSPPQPIAEVNEPRRSKRSSSALRSSQSHTPRPVPKPEPEPIPKQVIKEEEEPIPLRDPARKRRRASSVRSNDNPEEKSEPKADATEQPRLKRRRRSSAAKPLQAKPQPEPEPEPIEEPEPEPIKTNTRPIRNSRQPQEADTPSLRRHHRASSRRGDSPSPSPLPVASASRRAESAKRHTHREEQTPRVRKESAPAPAEVVQPTGHHHRSVKHETPAPSYKQEPEPEPTPSIRQHRNGETPRRKRNTAETPKESQNVEEERIPLRHHRRPAPIDTTPKVTQSSKQPQTEQRRKRRMSTAAPKSPEIVETKPIRKKRRAVSVKGDDLPNVEIAPPTIDRDPSTESDDIFNFDDDVSDEFIEMAQPRHTRLTPRLQVESIKNSVPQPVIRRRWRESDAQRAAPAPGNSVFNLDSPPKGRTVPAKAFTDNSYSDE